MNDDANDDGSAQRGNAKFTLASAFPCVKAVTASIAGIAPCGGRRLRTVGAKERHTERLGRFRLHKETPLKKNAAAKKRNDVAARQPQALATPTDLRADATRDIAGAMNAILADVFAMYLKTKNFHWHMSGPHFRDYHLLLDEQAVQLYAMTDPIAERIRKLGGSTLRSIGEIARLQRVLDNDAAYVEPLDMLAELGEDNKMLAARLREAHNVCDEHRDIATASLIEVWIDETERRTWFLFESSRRADSGGH
jgi:starvation-inducible DNA-binding protein